MAHLRALRVGVLIGGRVVEERLFRERQPVSVGQSVKNTFSVPGSTTSVRGVTLFEPSTDGYSLCFTKEMDGRVSLGQDVVALATLVEGPPPKDGVHRLRLTDKARGKIVLGDVTVLFQLVAPPPVQPRPQLPVSVRGSILRNLDWALAGLIATSFVVHFGFMVYLRSLDFPRVADVESLPDHFAQVVVPKPVEVKAIEVAVKPVDEAAPKVAKRAPKRAAPAPAQGSMPSTREQVQQTGVLKLLTGRGGVGLVADVLKHGDVSGDPDKVFDRVGGVDTVAGPARGLRDPGASAPGQLRRGNGLRAGGPETVDSGARKGESAVHGIVKETAPIHPDGPIDTGVIAKEIRSRLGGVKACYEAGLKHNPNIGGKVQLRFEISGIGKVVSAEIESDSMHDDDVTACIKSKVLTWRFPAPSGGSVQFSYPFIFQAAK